MKKLIIVTIGLLCAGQAWALTYIGPPTSDIEAGQFGIGFDYSNGKVGVKIGGYGLSGATDLDTSVTFGKLVFGLADRAEFFARLGLSDIDEDKHGGFSSNNEFAWGLGTKMTFAGEKDEPLNWGILFQFTALTADDTWEYYIFAGDSEIDAYEFQVAVGPSYKIDTLCLYGGPFLYFIDGDWDIKSGGTTFLSFDVEQETEFGGYVGLGWEITENSSLNVEYQFTDDAHAVGISLLNKFGRSPKPEKRIVTQRQTPILKTEPKVDDSSRKIEKHIVTQKQTPMQRQTPILKTEPKVDDSVRKIESYRLKRDESGELAKDKDGNFIFIPVYEEEQN